MKQFWSRLVSSIIQDDDSDLTRLDLLERAHRATPAVIPFPRTSEVALVDDRESA